MPRVGSEPTIPVFERAKTIHALERTATVIGRLSVWYSLKTHINTVATAVSVFRSSV
jgi:hypothetical protein